MNSRCTRARSSLPPGCISATASPINRRTGARISSARGVGISFWPARTRIGSSSAVRILASVWLIAGALRCMRCAAAVTLPVVNKASSAARRLRSSEFITCMYSFETMHCTECLWSWKLRNPDPGDRVNPLDASRTALATSLMRELHSRHDPAPLLDDDWGDRLVPDTVRAALCQRVLDSMPPAARGKAAELTPAAVLGQSLRANAAYADVITRTRYAEDALEAAVERGVKQYVIIGAGFDSFAYRRPSWAAELAVFEIDHPATQAMKRQRLAECGVDASTSVEFIAADLSAEALGSALARSSFQPTRSTFFSWLGVTMYLTQEANLSALRAIALCAPAGSELVFNYVDQRVFDPGVLVAEAFRKLKTEVSSAGEAFLSGFDPEILGEQLRATGLLLVEDLNGDQAVARYDASGVNGLRSAAASHIAHVRVAVPSLSPSPKSI